MKKKAKEEERQRTDANLIHFYITQIYTFNFCFNCTSEDAFLSNYLMCCFSSIFTLLLLATFCSYIYTYIYVNLLAPFFSLHFAFGSSLCICLNTFIFSFSLLSFSSPKLHEYVYIYNSVSLFPRTVSLVTTYKQ